MDFKEIRRLFLEFFRSKGHEIVESSSLIPKDDPTLLFTNAGMVQFKKLFLGTEKRPYTRAATAQKCVRAGGKHNDLENVGYTHRHHTFFEMLGNFSFGDYFKKEAIEWAWELLTQYYRLDPEDLYVSVFEKDDEAFAIWERDIGIPPSKIYRLGEENNFWTMGETGPCGPCSEIYIDLGPDVGCGKGDCSPGCDCDRYLEIWNLVFTQFDRAPDGTLFPLAKPNIDTGMGLERLASVIQGVKSNFDTDLFSGIISRIEEISSSRYGLDKKKDISFRVIADHSRAIAFLIADGVMPSNEGRGYVLRRIIRRAIRFGLNLGVSKGLLWPVCEKVIETMSFDYPELLKAKNAIQGIVDNEERRFHDTLEQGIKVLTEELEALKAKGLNTIPGHTIFRLYDTYGLSVDILADVAREEGLSLDLEGYSREMEAQRHRSQEAWKGSGATTIPSHMEGLLSQQWDIQFTGYETLESEGHIIALFRGGVPVKTMQGGDYGEVILDRTCFYGEAGGQVGDKGEILGRGSRFIVEDTKKYGHGLIVHYGKLVNGTLSVGQGVTTKVDKEARLATQRHHTSTHLLHAALRSLLGDHVKQAGSLVAPNRLRFDFTHFTQVGQDRLEELEALVNEYILENIPIKIQVMGRKEAMSGDAIAIFEEKYGEEVRVVEVPGISKELCGGTHVKATGDIGLFKIISESGIAANVRRIEALSGMEAFRYIQAQERTLKELARLLKTSTEEILLKVQGLIQQQRDLTKEIEKLNQRLLSKTGHELLEKVREVRGIKVISTIVEADSPKALRDAGDKIKERLKSGIIVLGAKTGDKAMVLAMVSKDLMEKIKAGDIVSEVSGMLGGKGGGRPDMAQGGGPNKDALEHALESVYGLIEKLLG